MRVKAVQRVAYDISSSYAAPVALPHAILVSLCEQSGSATS